MEGFLLVMFFFIPFAFVVLLGAAFLFGVLKESLEMKESALK
jgi:hypothetical protein